MMNLVTDLLRDVLPRISTHVTTTIEPEDETHFSSKGFPHSLILTNDASAARDYLANERTFLSWLRLSITLSVVSLAVIVSFHLRSQPTKLEQDLALPMGTVFWVLALLCLGSGLANYSNTVRGYAARKPVVEAGPKTVAVFAIVATVIIATSILFIITKSLTS